MVLSQVILQSIFFIYVTNAKAYHQKFFVGEEKKFYRIGYKSCFSRNFWSVSQSEKSKDKKEKMRAKMSESIFLIFLFGYTFFEGGIGEGWMPTFCGIILSGIQFYQTLLTLVFFSFLMLRLTIFCQGKINFIFTWPSSTMKIEKNCIHKEKKVW